MTKSRGVPTKTCKIILADIKKLLEIEDLPKGNIKIQINIYGGYAGLDIIGGGHIKHYEPGDLSKRGLTKI